jgi:plasmid maintenance system antidote protein VapI
MTRPHIDTALIERDMVAAGWLITDLAAAASLPYASIHRALRSGRPLTARMGKRLADALGHDLERYVRIGGSVTS